MDADALKAFFKPYRTAMENFDPDEVRSVMDELFAPDATFKIFHPFGTFSGPEAFLETCLIPLHQAMPDIERRDLILLAGTTAQGLDWIGCMGNYMGTFLGPFLDIPPTGTLAHMRYHEYFHVRDGKIVEVQAIWDVPELMMQANAWPLAPQLGAYLCTPGPLSGDGLTVSGDGQKSIDRVVDMETALCRHPDNPDPRVMRLEDHWHPRMNWYGPAGIGTGRGIAGFRHWHQIPFLRGMPNRKVDPTGDREASEEMYDLHSHYIAQGDYVCETGWPNMRLTVSHDGWLGIAPSGKNIEMRSLDFWRFEKGLIRENWVLIDMLDIYRQLGVDVLARLAEFNKARNLGRVNLSDGMEMVEPRK